MTESEQLIAALQGVLERLLAALDCESFFQGSEKDQAREEAMRVLNDSALKAS